jgi:phosphoglycolate phosphatase-like HAD superfamily hydrolase
MKIRAVLFDLDGTLINTTRLYLEAYRRALQPDLGRLATDAEILAIDSRTERRVFESCLPPGAVADCMQRFYKHYAELHTSHFEGFTRASRSFCRRCVRCDFLWESSREKSGRVEATAAATQLGHFDVVVVEDDVAQPKPDPSGLHTALIAVGCEPVEALYVGDGAHDLHAAHAAGIFGVAALWSKRGERRARLERIAREVGAALASSPADVLTLL